MPLSKFVYETTSKDGRPIYFHSILNKYVSTSAPEELLRSESFFEESDSEAIRYRLTNKDPIGYRFEESSKTFGRTFFGLITTWECNLRCGHCDVIHKLVKKDKDDFFDPDKLVSFFDRYSKHCNSERIGIGFVGGEPLLKLDLMERLVRLMEGLSVIKEYTMTTNLVCQLTDRHFDFLSKMDIGFTVSLDGTEDLHNKQRHAYHDGIENPFEVTFQNIKELVKAGFAGKFFVQGAIPDEYMTEERKLQYFKMLMRIGVPISHISFGGIHPSYVKPVPSKTFLGVSHQPKITRHPCCKYRMNNFTINGDYVYDDWHTWNPLIKIDGDISELLANQQQLIFKSMPALNDPACLSCPVLGFCWGQCSQNIHTGMKPSELCNQPALIAKVSDLAKTGRLISTDDKEIEL